jgi:hypothetical protein
MPTAELKLLVSEPRGGTIPYVRVTPPLTPEAPLRVEFTPQEPGVHTLGARVGEQLLTDRATVIEAILGVRQHEAKDCVLGGSADTLADSGGMVGTHAMMTVQSALFDYGQLMSGSEKVHTDLHASAFLSPMLGHHTEARELCCVVFVEQVRVVVTAPSGVMVLSPVKFLNGIFQAPIYW